MTCNHDHPRFVAVDCEAPCPPPAPCPTRADYEAARDRKLIRIANELGLAGPADLVAAVREHARFHAFAGELS